MDTVNTVVNISLLLLVTYIICYFIVFVTTLYDLAARGKGSLLDNPYLAKLFGFLSTFMYYVIYSSFVALEGMRIFILKNVSFRNAFLFFLILLSLVLSILYTKIY
jgi:hypothetical protein